MPKQMLDLSTTELKALRKFYKRGPKQFARATAGVLNTYAFESRNESLAIIHSRMIVRDTRFVKSAIRVQKAKGNIETNSQFSKYGSINRPRFTGWAEQEQNTPDKRSRIATTFARGDKKAKKIKTSLRLKSSNQFESSEDHPGKTAHHRSVIMLQIKSRQKGVKRPFILKGHRKLPDGLYRMQRGRLRLVQRFEDPRTKIKRVRWMSGGVAVMIRRNKPRDIWARNLNPILRKR